MVRNSTNAGIPPEIIAQFEELFPDRGDLSLDEVLMTQEGVYESLRTNRNNFAGSSGRFQFTGHAEQGSTRNSTGGAESSGSVSDGSQIALDEAIAWSLQEMEDGFHNMSLSANAGNSAGDSRLPRDVPGQPSPSMSIQHNIDPDNMTYEELQNLGEAIGTADKGLSEPNIARLPSFKYKARGGWFAKKTKVKDNKFVLYATARFRLTKEADLYRQCP
ncbi:hypothetical protein RJ641_007994 [Dillenia turbinata]|uniref:Uncharacterized protein n=1 Tax=Dillenia turbinata TaxID=194707 RepID=A0AAN8V2B0_9MAGN